MRRKAKTITQNKTPGIKIPGKIFEKHITFGVPELQGVYLCFYKPHGISDEIYPVSGMEISNWYKGKWGTKKQVVAFMGPLPVPLLDELYDNKECISVVFYISTLKAVTENKFKSGPHFQYRIAQLQKGKKGLFIFKIDAQKTIPFPVARYNKAKGKWVTITKVDKYLKIIQKYRKRQK